MSWCWRALGGATGNLAAVVFSYPLDLYVTNKVIGRPGRTLHYGGLSLTLLGHLVSSFLFWFLFETFGSVVASLANVLALTPLWNVAQRQQARKGSVMSTCKALYARSGLAGFYHGLSLDLLLICYPVLQTFLQQELVAFSPVLSGGLASLSATLLSFPFMLMRTRIILRHPVLLSRKRPVEDHLKWHYNGVEAKLLKSFVSGMILFGVRSLFV